MNNPSDKDEYLLLRNQNQDDKHDHKDHKDHDHVDNKALKSPKGPSPILVENTLKNQDTLRKLWTVSFICLIFMCIEVTGGYLASSIAIMSDAAHLLSDFLGFLISIVSIYISRRKATAQMSFGYHRAEVIGAMVSISIIWGLTIWLLYEATLRIIDPPKVNGFIMLITAVIGFVFNIVMGVILAYQGIDHNLHHHHEGHGHEHDHNALAAFKRSNSLASKGTELKKVDTYVPPIKHAKTLVNEKSHKHSHDEKDVHADEHGHKHSDHGLNEGEVLLSSHSHSHDDHGDHSHDHDHGHGHSHGGDGENVNLRAALVHVIGDALQNLGVVIAGLLIYFRPDWSVADPICTYVFSIIVTFTTIRILKDCIGVLMEGSPLEFNIEQLTRDLQNVRGVEDIHDLHVWSLSVGKLSLSCHLTSSHPQITLRKASKLCRDKYKINHSTIQVEHAKEKTDYDCRHDLH